MVEQEQQGGWNTMKLTIKNCLRFKLREAADAQWLN